MSKPSPKPAPKPAADARRSVLGVAVTSDAIEAVLLRQTGDQVDVVKRFIRSRARRAELANADNLALALPDLKTTGDADYTLEVGDGGGSSVAFLENEFAGLGQGKNGGKGADQTVQAALARPFAAQLREVLQECVALGYTDVPVVFAEGPPHVRYAALELPAPPESRSATAKNGRAADAPAQPFTVADRKRLLALLATDGDVPAEDRVAFYPLVSEGAERRVLALVAEPTEPVAATLAILQEKDAAGLPATRVLSAELAAYAALVRHTTGAAPGERSALVRVGEEDTLVLFFDGTGLLHGERLRSVTAYDLPETVVSRVLLQQDEKKLGDLHSVLVVGSGRVDRLLESFESFFPDAAIEPLERLLQESGVRLPDVEDDALRSATLTATVSGLSALKGWTDASENLLPQTLRRRRRRRRVAPWYTLVASLLVVAALALAGYRYVVTQAVLESEREELRLNPPVLPSDDPEQLQARVDSLNTAYATYTRALYVLDSLLVGSDKWTQGMSRVTTATANTGGVWISSWRPENGQLRLKGHAVHRLRIVDLARRLYAPIDLLNYEDIGGQRIYTFEMLTALPEEMPEVANFLRAVAAGTLDAAGADHGELEVNPSEATRARD